jgi:hypothetical protein
MIMPVDSDGAACIDTSGKTSEQMWRNPMIYLTNSIRHTVLALSAVAMAAAPAAGQATYRIVANMVHYAQPGQLTEVWPGTFYSQASSEVAFSVTTKGKLTTLASFSSQNLIGAPFIPGPNGRFYDSSGGSGTAYMISLGKEPNTLKTYSNQAVGASLYQNLPDGTFVGLGFGSGNTRYLATVDLEGKVTPFYQFPLLPAASPTTVHSPSSTDRTATCTGLPTCRQIRPTCTG